MKFALILAVLAAPAHSEVFKTNDWIIETPTTLTIRVDNGGNIDAYAEVIAQTTKEVRIVGACKSACTMFLAAQNVCVDPEASLGFHGPSATDESIAHLLELVSIIASHYPPEISYEFTSSWGLEQDLTWRTGAEVLALSPSIRSCAP